MGLRILHSADWHLGFPFGSFDPEQRKYLTEQLARIPWKVADLCRREHCDLVLLAGDILDTPTERRYSQLLKQALKACAVPVLIAPGNHDHLREDSPWLREIWPENVHIFSGDLSSIPFANLDCRIWGAGYTSMDCPGLLEGFRAEGPERWQLGVLHGDPMRRNGPYCPVTAEQMQRSGLHYLALGHIHKEGNFRGGGLCAWPGAPMGLGFDEPGPKGVYIVELEENVRLRRVSLDGPEFYDLELNEAQLEIAPEGRDPRHFYRITVTGEGNTPLEGALERWKAFSCLQVTDRRMPAPDPWSRIGEDTLEGVYFRLLREKLDRADGEDREIIDLAAKLSAGILEGREVTL